MKLRIIPSVCRLLFFPLFAAALTTGGQAIAGIVAYQVPAGVAGNQTDAGGHSFGMDFNVNSPVSVDQIGVFDSSQNGLIAPIQAAIYDRITQSLVSPIVTFAAGSGAGSGTLSGGSRFLPIAPLTLPAGFQGSIITFGYGDGTSGELDGNTFGAAAGTPTFPWTTNDGGGRLSFVGGGRYSDPNGTSISYPLHIDTGPVNRYAAGTFDFLAVPEPSSLALLLIAALASISFANRRSA
jgi:hypothetical protein